MSTVALGSGTVLPKTPWDALNSSAVSAGLEDSVPRRFWDALDSGTVALVSEHRGTHLSYLGLI